MAGAFALVTGGGGATKKSSTRAWREGWLRMWRGFGVLMLAWAAFASPAAAQVAAGADDYPGTVRLQPLWTQSLRTRVVGLDVAAAPPDASSGYGLGFDRRFGSWLMGLRGDWFSGQGCARVDPFNANSVCPALNWQGAAAGRIGYAWDRLVAYTQGGAVFSQWDRVALADTAPTVDANKPITRGWLIGGGLEYALGTNWSIRAEYNYLDYGRPDPSSAAAVTNLTEPADAHNHMLMFGLKRRL
jgi:opacity protein-like surface antigen